MATIESLRIAGIRSFNPYRASKIEFYSPVTLIVGENGAGKTTVIECLKFALTSKAPSGKGTSFVMDPRIIGHSTVRAKVQLDFTVDGRGYSAIRLCSVVAANEKMTYKLADNTFVDKTSGNSQTMNIESMNTQLSEYFEVSEAILSYVIFCHQEDTLWPLETQTHLKDIFNKIFSSSPYMTVKEPLKQLQKSLREDQDKFFRNLTQCEANRRLATEKQQELDQKRELLLLKRAEVERLKDRRRCLSPDVEKYKSESKRMFDVSADLKTSETKISNLISEIDYLNRIVDPIIQEMDIEKVQKAIESSDLELAKWKLELKSEEENLTTLQNEWKLKNSQLQDCNSDLESFHRLKSDMVALQEKRHQKLNDLKQIPCCCDLNDTFAMDELTTLLESQESEFLKWLQESKLVEIQLESEVRMIIGQQASCNSELKILDSKLNDIKLILPISDQSDNPNSLLLKQLANAAKEVELSKHDLEKLECEISKMSESLDHLRDNYSRNSSKLVEANNLWRQSIKEHEPESTKFRNLVDERSRLDTSISRSWELIPWADWERECNTSEMDLEGEGDSSYNMALSSLLFKESKVSRLHSVLQAKVEDAEKKKTELSSRRASLEIIRTQLEEQEVKLKQLKSSIASPSLSIMQLEELSQNLENNLTHITERIHRFQSTAHIYKEINNDIQSSNSCPICACTLNDKDSAQLEYSSLDSEYLKLKETQHNYNQIRPSLFEIQFLTASVEEFKQHLQFAESEVDKKLRETEQDKQAEENNRILLLTQLQTSLRRLLDIVPILEEMETHYSEGIPIPTLQYEARVSEAEQEQSRLQNEIGVAESELVTMKSRLKENQAIHVQQLHKLDADKLRLQMAIDDPTKGVELILEAQQLELKYNSKLSECNELNTLVEQKEKAQVKIKDEHEAERSRKETELNRIRESVKFLSALATDIELKRKHLQEYQEHTLLTLKMKLQSRLDCIKSEEEAINHRVNKYKVQINSFIYSSALRLREKQVELETEKVTCSLLETCKKELEFAVREFDNSVKEHDQVAQKLTALESEVAIYSSEQARVERILSDPAYANIESNYNSALVNLVTCKAAIEDLKKCMDAVDQSLMKYHSIKMEEVNHNIRELWRTAYKNSDIETIEIAIEPVAQASGKTRNQFNYGVNMIRQGVSLPMRGHSSAETHYIASGQRMIASIIIRLALAEAFCISSTILALDEPTTNLDRNNKESLAAVLARLIEERSAHPNFLLIIITHDEEFMEMLRGSSDTGVLGDYYWRISKDSKFVS